jgi:hypothetical protein
MMAHPDGATDPTTADATEALTAQTYNGFIADLQLLGIDVVRISGERRRSGHAAQTRFDLAAAWQPDDETIQWRYDVTAHLTDPDDADYGSVEASVIIAGRARTAPDPACAEQFGRTSGAMMAHPYLREAIATTALRLGFTGVLLPLVTQQPTGGAAAPAEDDAEAAQPTDTSTARSGA